MHFIIKICILKEYVTFEVLPKCLLRSSIRFSHTMRRYKEASSGFVNMHISDLYHRLYFTLTMQVSFCFLSTWMVVLVEACQVK